MKLVQGAGFIPTFALTLLFTQDSHQTPGGCWQGGALPLQAAVVANGQRQARRLIHQRRRRCQ